MNRFSRAWRGLPLGARVALAALSVTAAPLHSAWASPQVDNAMTLIKATCALPNTSLDIKPTPEGRLELRITLANGQRRVVALVKGDVEPFSASSAAALASQPVELSGCMDPYIQDVITAMSSLPERPTGPAAQPTYVPPTYAPPAPGPAPVIVPVRPALPATGDLPVGVINGTALAAPAGVAVAVVAPAPAPVPGEISFRVTGCRAHEGKHVMCDVKATNGGSKDLKLIIQGAFTKLYGDEGSQVAAGWVTMGNQKGDMRHGWNRTQQAQLDLTAGTAPVLNLFFYDVPPAMTTIKRLEVSLGPQTSNGIEMQKITLADVPIQGR